MSALRIISPAIAAAFLVGCSAASDPANEAPVTLADGEYQVTMTGQAPSMLGTRTVGIDDLPPKICLAAPDDAGKVAKLARTYYSMMENCPHSGNERVGNQVSGDIFCATDADRAPGGKIGIEYTGTIAADAVRLDGKLRFDLPSDAMSPEDQQLMEQGKAEMDKVSMVVEAKRIGDCATQSWQ